MSARDLRSHSLQFGFSSTRIASLTASLNCGGRAALARYRAPRFHCRVLPWVLTGTLAEPTSRLASPTTRAQNVSPNWCGGGTCTRALLAHTMKCQPHRCRKQGALSSELRRKTYFFTSVNGCVRRTRARSPLFRRSRSAIASSANGVHRSMRPLNVYALLFSGVTTNVSFN